MLSLPKILCLHGAGSSGAIFRSHSRKICRALENEFDFVFLDAPFPSAAGPGMYPVYHESGPLFRWHCDGLSAEDWDITEDEIRMERKAVRQLTRGRLGGDGDGASFVGILAFSQGVRVATGLLLSLLTIDGWQLPELRFVVLCSGTYPPLLIHDDSTLPLENELIEGEKRQ
jgi:pimeloyl-ACP methyl ester carboxylesterase